MDAFRDGNIRPTVLRILYFSHLWIPMREKLLAHYGAKKFAALKKKAEREEQEVAIVGQRNEKPEVIDQLLPEIKEHFRWGQHYYKFSTIVHAFNLVSSSILFYLSDQRSDNPGGGLRLEDGKFALLCHTPRVTIYGIDSSLVESVAYALSMLHLLWRFFAYRFEGEFLLNPILFLLMNDYRMIEDPRKGAEETYHQHKTLELTQSIMMYKIESYLFDKVKFCVRPNRSLDSRAIQIRTLEISSLSTRFVLVSMAFFVVPAAVRTFLVAPQVAYAGCNVTLFNLTHLYRLIGSLILTSTIAFDIFSLIACRLEACAIIIVDLMLYWGQIKSILANHLRTMQKLGSTSSSMAEESDQCWRSRYPRALLEGGTSITISQPLAGAQSRPLRLASHHFSKYYYSQIYLCQPEARTAAVTGAVQNPDTINYEIQSMVSDFFTQLGYCDEYMSIEIALALSIWLGCNGIVTLMGLQTGQSASFATHVLIRIVQLIGIAVLFTFISVILIIKRATEPAYRTICSIMAHDLSMEKKRWVLLLKYYTGKHPRHAFTILHSKIFTLGTFLSTLSYTFTFGLFLQSFRRH